MSAWTPKYADIIATEGDLCLAQMLDGNGRPSQYPPRWYVVQLVDGKPDWSTVTYHRYFSEAQRRLGINAHHPPHPDLARPGD
jgi:hypothetical protein